jgi:hypothetical protein
VRDRVDPKRVAEHAVREHERKPTHDEAPHAVLEGNVRERWGGRRERGDQLDGAFDGRVEALAASHGEGATSWRTIERVWRSAWPRPGR